MQPISNDISETEFVIGGYYFIQGSKLQPWMNAKLLPSKIWSASRCICEKVPDAWIFPWNTNPDPREVRGRYQSALGLNEDEFQELQNQFDKLLSLEEFGYPNVFMSRTLAEGFYARYFYKLPDIKLISISLPKDDVQAFIEKIKASEGVAENGVRKKLRQYQLVERDVKPIGFDVLGYDYADFHSLICGSMEEEVNLKYGVNFNQYGLIDRRKETITIVQDIREGVLVVEEGYWGSWMVSEYPLNTANGK